jgi:lipoprotein-anchoring transpeptidase ErfK/SrfK
VAVLLFAGSVTARMSSRPIDQADKPSGTLVPYQIELVSTDRIFKGRFTKTQLAVLEKLNRADVTHLSRLDALVVPSVWDDDDLRYSPFPLQYRTATHLAKLLVVDQPAQAFAAYEAGHLVRWGPVSSGRQGHPTPSGLFHLNWRSRARHSSVNPKWYMEWYFNFENRRGLALHSYVLPGYPASHACVRLLERDAIWIYEWGEGWTPLLIAGHYAFGEPPPWRSLEFLARGIELPDAPFSDDIEHHIVEQTVGCEEP